MRTCSRQIASQVAQTVKNPHAIRETWLQSLGWKDPLEKGMDSTPVLGTSPGGGNGYPLQYSGLENSLERGAWRATGHGVAKSRTQLSDFYTLCIRDCALDRQQLIPPLKL